MARGRDLSLDIRNTIIKLYLDNRSYREIGKIIGKAHSTVQSVIMKYINSGQLGADHSQAGRPKKLTVREERSIIATVSKNPKITTTEILRQIQEEGDKKVCPQTIRNCLNKAE